MTSILPIPPPFVGITFLLSSTQPQLLQRQEGEEDGPTGRGITVYGSHLAVFFHLGVTCKKSELCSTSEQLSHGPLPRGSPSAREFSLVVPGE